MIYIESIHLKDFQTHKDTKIEFSPYFNVIVGPTRSGKSSVVRALDFLMYNDWYKGYQRFDSTTTEITVKLSNGKTVIRTKSEKVNKILIKVGKEEQRFEAFGTSLPDEVIQALGVIPVDIGAKDAVAANVANQDDPLFLLYTTGTERTKVLSRLSGLHWIDFALKDLNKDKRAKSSEIAVLKASNEEIQRKLKGFSRLESLEASLKSSQSRLDILKNLAEIYEKGQQLLQKTVNWKQTYREIQRLKRIDFNKEAQKLERLIDIHSNIYLKALDLSRKFSANSSSLYNMRDYIVKLNKDMVNLEVDIQEELTKTQICPECGQEILEGAVHE